MAEGDRHAPGVGDRLLRLSVGLEDVDDLWADPGRAPDRAMEPVPGQERAGEPVRVTAGCGVGRGGIRPGARTAAGS
ncbi:PLP-dependent transferase [Streptomyces sp. NBC_00335]|uniref:PLP-dependent transferase n=1 Tax=unclassified Streptomyces TaxID=2593676 RepID=UPI002253945D|nr:MULTISPECIES: PLP-dependent transferase [unclassified Streptomyces]MCX5408713.1 PLP-dependent transferase [Streptomyces sp. NBC_00086]